MVAALTDAGATQLGSFGPPALSTSWILATAATNIASQAAIAGSKLDSARAGRVSAIGKAPYGYR